MHTDTGSILIHGDIFTIKQNILSQWRKKFRIYKMFSATREGPGVNIRMVVRTDTKACEMNSQICQCNTECVWLLSTPLLLTLHASFIQCTWLAFKIPTFNAIHGLPPRQELQRCPSPLCRLLGYLKVGNASRPNFFSTSNKMNVWTFETAF